MQCDMDQALTVSVFMLANVTMDPNMALDYYGGTHTHTHTKHTHTHTHTTHTHTHTHSGVARNI